MPAVIKIELKDGRTAEVSFLSKKDSTRELLLFINRIIAEKAYLIYDKKFTRKQEGEWKRKELEASEKKEGFLLVARVDGKIVATSGARMGNFKERRNVCLGIAVAKPFRSIGLGEALLRLNIRTARKLFKPKNIYLSVIAMNRPAYSLYKKLGFKEFAVFPKWIFHRGKYIDHVFLRL